MQIGAQVAEAIRLHTRFPRREAAARAAEVLARVGLPAEVAPPSRCPHELLGERRQRVAIAELPSATPDLDAAIAGRRLGNLEPVLGKASGHNNYMGWLGSNFDPSIAWSDLDWIRSEWDGPLLIKGILDAEDAREAAAIGADGIVVSNHGGRQFDGVLSSARPRPASPRRSGISRRY